MRMRELLSAVAILMTFSIGPLLRADLTTAGEAALAHLEKTWNDAQLAGDADALDKLWDNDFTVIVPKMQPITKANALAMLRSGHVKFLRYETSDLSTRIYNDTAIVTGKLLRVRKMGDREMQDDWYFTKVYIKRGNDWRVVLWQASEQQSQSSPSPAASPGSK